MNLIETIRDVSDIMDALGVAIVSIGVLVGLIFLLKTALHKPSILRIKTFEFK